MDSMTGDDDNNLSSMYNLFSSVRRGIVVMSGGANSKRSVQYTGWTGVSWVFGDPFVRFVLHLDTTVED